MSSTLNDTQYQIDISANQPSGAVFQIQLTLYQESDFGDAQAEAMYNAILATVPSSWSPSPSLSKSVNNSTFYNWSATAGAFE